MADQPADHPALLPLELAGHPAPDERAAELLAQVVSPLADTTTRSLSGAEQQASP